MHQSYRQLVAETSLSMRSLLLCALLASIGAAASDDQQDLRKRQLNEASVLSVLLTALPPSLLVLAATNEAAASSAILQEFLTGTPSWYQNLPTEVQNYLLSSTATNAYTTGPTRTTFASSVSTRSVALGLPSSITALPGYSSIASAAATPAGSNDAITQDEGGLSSGTKIGIGVGAGVGVIALIAAIAIFFTGKKRRARHRNEAATAAASTPAYQHLMPEKQGAGYYGHPQGQTYNPVPAGTTEMPTYANVSEMAAPAPKGYNQGYPQFAAELPATQGGGR
ncbi:hypothetical protein W97_00390 [Coniosporium apollinis CBS 100218]|uniref:Mid2 domain-containing protein n=1 Tax=Coniosporium apollinis (strain CBS 100218) TaxID=1168221 RepID=R7YH18_CONA1|nr:uncharacterized protein W97_00390 [Coniosporium apollinis CBS 100218]EON61178.1 hypothetical protein W97_00390 [Coniosporium apollinis CBS 100218]